MQKIKEWFIAGMILSLPFIVFYFLVEVAVGLTSFWREPFIGLSIEEYYFGIMGPFLTFFVAVFFGFFITSDFIHSIARRILGITRVFPFAGPFAEKIWLSMRGLAKRVIFISRGGYKVIIYEEHGKGHGRWRAAFVIGKTVFKYAERGVTKEKLMLVIITPQLQIPDPRWIAPEDTKIVTDGGGSIGLLLATGGFVNPDDMPLEEWTKEKYDEIPEYKNEEPLEPPKDDKKEEGGGK